MEWTKPGVSDHSMALLQSACGFQGLDGVIVMGGPLGRLLVNKGLPEDTRIWSAISLVEEQHHRMVVDAHKEYIEAGAMLITTNNYGIQPTYYRRAFEVWEARIARDAEVSAKLAVQARAQSGAEKRVRILGCFHPLRGRSKLLRAHLPWHR